MLPARMCCPAMLTRPVLLSTDTGTAFANSADQLNAIQFWLLWRPPRVGTSSWAQVLI